MMEAVSCDVLATPSTCLYVCNDSLWDEEWRKKVSTPGMGGAWQTFIFKSSFGKRAL